MQSHCVPHRKYLYDATRSRASFGCVQSPCSPCWGKNEASAHSFEGSMKKKSTRKKRQATLKIPDCKRFTGYKPCFPGSTCYTECADPEPIGKKNSHYQSRCNGSGAANDGDASGHQKEIPAQPHFVDHIEERVPTSR